MIENFLLSRKKIYLFREKKKIFKEIIYSYSRSMTSVDLNNLSINELKKLVKKEFNENKKLKERKKELIEVYQKLQMKTVD